VHRSLEEVRELVFGRAPECEVVLTDRDASRRHARVVYGDDRRVVLEDLGSTNGTQVNGERLRGPRELRDNDVIELGGAVYRFLRARSLEKAMRDTL
jgi:pSer/pThr/pTyr-binding forkhead associated (FHA) protein